MSTLVVIRHGQASYGAANYDELSELGTEQSFALGQFFAQQGSGIDQIYVGPKVRHQQTYDAMCQGAQTNTLRLPDAIPMTDLDEFPAFELFRMHYPPANHTNSDDIFSGVAESKFPILCQDWMTGDLDSGAFETAAQFESRILRSMLKIASEKPGTRSCLVTSGGPVMMAMKLALSLDALSACKLLWVTANSSVSEFRFRDGAFDLHSFNTLSHLSTENITYR